MDPKQGNQYQTQANRLLNECIVSQEAGYGLGSMSCSIYDTAWVACVSKEISGRRQWLFPGSFLYVLDQQKPDGGWDGPILTDRIISSLSAFYALLRHSKHPYQLGCRLEEGLLDQCISKASSFLADAFSSWRPGDAPNVGFEIIIPAMLDLLHREGFTFKAESSREICSLRDEKLQRMPSDALYNGNSSLLHSLEAFFGNDEVNFDKVELSKAGGNIMASPAATAAWLMRRSSWDDEAEAYLRLVYCNGEGRCDGGVPSAFPSTYFETIWTASVLINSSFGCKDIDEQIVESLLKLVRRTETSGAGIGFCEGMPPDLDDTSKLSSLASALGNRGLSASLQTAFGASTHFKTYAHERNPSFSANANALRALADDIPSRMQTESDVITLLHFLNDKWRASHGFPLDKWNMSPLYSALSMTQAYSSVLRARGEGAYRSINTGFLLRDMLLVLLDCLVKVIQSQNPNGSWGTVGPREETAYALLILAEEQWLPFCNFLKTEIVSAVEHGKQFLLDQCDNTSAERIWVEKVTYGSNLISRAYQAAAMRDTLIDKDPGSELIDLCVFDEEKLAIFTKVTAMVPLVASCPKWIVVASWLEGELYSPSLRSRKDMIFSRNGLSEDKYFQWIPFIWFVATNATHTLVSLDFVTEMMTLSFLNFQVDECMESIGGMIDDSLGLSIESLLDRELGRGRYEDSATMKETKAGILRFSSPDVIESCERRNIHPGVHVNGEILDTTKSLDGYSTSPHSLEPLRNYLRFVINHPKVKLSSSYDQKVLRSRLREFVLAHMQQSADNAYLKFCAKAVPSQEQMPLVLFEQESRPWKTWVRGTAADHTSCPFSLAFACCLSSQEGRDAFPTSRLKYIADDFCRHLATMCRMQNDYGSLQRDLREDNLNCANFAELHGEAKPFVSTALTTPALSNTKMHLLELSEYERNYVEMTLEMLRGELGTGIGDMLNIFKFVTDFFGQIYVVKDLASSKVEPVR